MDVPLRIANSNQGDLPRLQRNCKDRLDSQTLIELVLIWIEVFNLFGIGHNHGSSSAHCLYPAVEKFRRFKLICKDSSFIFLAFIVPPEWLPQPQIQINLNQTAPVGIIEFTGRFHDAKCHLFWRQVAIIQLRFQIVHCVFKIKSALDILGIRTFAHLIKLPHNNTS